MKKIIRWVTDFSFPPLTFPFVLLGISIVSYGIMIPWLGFYWDDLPFVWISQNLGSEAITAYFSTKRPFLGMLYQLTTPLVGKVPWHWQVFGLFWRWANAVSFWWLIRTIWPKRANLAAWASVLFLVYPGFDQQYIPIAYAHYFITLTAFFLSLGFTILALRNPKKFWQYTALALILSAVNLLTTEYFYLLDLLRLPLIWITLEGQIPERKKRFGQTLRTWIPYFVVFLAPTIWRLFFFQYQTYSYDPMLLEDMKAQPFQTIFALMKTVLHDIWMTSFTAWGSVFQIPTVKDLGNTNFMRFVLIAVGLAVGLTIYLLKFNARESDASADRQAGIQMILLGLAGIFIAGWPFWLTKLPISLSFPNSRFTLPFMLGVSFLFAGLLQVIPTWLWTKILLLSAAVGLAVGSQFQIALDYRRDWDWHSQLIWEMTWRMPQLEHGTLIIGNYLPGTHYSDNSLTAPLNYIYSPENRSDSLDYMYYYPSVRYGRQIKSWEKEQPIKHDYLVGKFMGNTSQVITIYHKAPDCLRVLDPDLDPEYMKLDKLMRSAAALSTTDPILAVSAVSAAIPIPEIYGSEPEHNWCYYYEKADLARQQDQWKQVIELGEQGLNLGYTPGNPIEWIPFIEGYAHIGSWEKAQSLTIESQSDVLELKPALCRLWDRIEAETPQGPDKDAALKAVRNELDCNQK